MFFVKKILNRVLRVFPNITREKKKALVLLQMLQTAIDASRDGIMIVNAQGAITYMNEAIKKILAIQEYASFKDIEHGWYTVFDAQSEQKIRYEILPFLMQQGFWRGKLLIERQDKTAVHTEFSILKLEDGGLICSMLDITEEQKARDEKDKMEDQFFQAQKMEAIGRLTGGIAHDFNNILAAMNGYAEFLIEDLPENSQQQKFAQNILQAGTQARDLVDRMLAFSRRSDGAVQNIDILSSVKETSVMLQASLPRTIEVVTDIRIDQALIKGNATQIAQTIMNLCVNAKDAMEDEHGVLTLHVNKIHSDDFKLPWALSDDFLNPQELVPIRIEELSEVQTLLVLGHLKKNTHYIVMRVQDTGSGMSKIVMEHIFEPFFTTKPVDKGTGLGLATVHGVITGHQGMLVVESVLGKGTIFDMYFPCTENQEKIQNDELAISKSANVNRGGEIRVLLVEDQQTVREMLVNMLKRIGCKVETAVNGLDALDLIRENPNHYDLVITDHNMPKMTGLELAQQVYVDMPEIPFIIISGYNQKEMQDIQEGHPAIRAVLKKPVPREVLEQHIRTITGQKKAQNAA